MSEKIIEENKEFKNVLVQLFGETLEKSDNPFDKKVAGLKMYNTNEDPLFMAKEIGEILDLTNINSSLKDYSDELIRRKCLVILNGKKTYVNMLTEFGLYRVVMRSNSAFGEKFSSYISGILRQLRILGSVKLETLQKEYDILKIDYQEAKEEVGDLSCRVSDLMTYEIEVSRTPRNNIDSEEINYLIQKYYMKEYGIFMVKPSFVIPEKKEKKTKVPESSPPKHDLSFLQKEIGLSGPVHHDFDERDTDFTMMNPLVDDTLNETMFYYHIGEIEKCAKHGHFKLAKSILVVDRKMIDAIRESLKEYQVEKPGPKLARKKIFYCSLESILNSRTEILINKLKKSD